MTTLFEYRACKLRRAAGNIAGFLLAATVDLIKAAVDIGDANVVADFAAVLADYTGYAQGTITWGDPTVAADGTVESIGTVDPFTPSGSGEANNIYGLFIRDAAGTGLLYAGLFDVPKAMTGTTSQLTLIVRFRPADETITVEVE